MEKHEQQIRLRAKVTQTELRREKKIIRKKWWSGVFILAEVSEDIHLKKTKEIDFFIFIRI